MWLFQPNAAGYNINLVNVNNQFSKFPLLSIDQSEFYRFAGGLKGQLGSNYSWEVGVDLNRYHLGLTSPGQIDTANLNAALASGAINPFAYQQASGTLPSNVIGTKTNNMVSTLASADFVFRGTRSSCRTGA